MAFFHRIKAPAATVDRSNCNPGLGGSARIRPYKVNVANGPGTRPFNATGVFWFLEWPALHPLNLAG